MKDSRLREYERHEKEKQLYKFELFMLCEMMKNNDYYAYNETDENEIKTEISDLIFKN